MQSDTQAQSVGTFDHIVIGAGTAGCLLANACLLTDRGAFYC